MIDLPNFLENKEFEFLIQPRSETYTDGLAEDIVDHGCTAPVEVWENYIIDGHLRYEICRKWEVPFQIKTLSFRNENEALSYLCEQQLKRDDLTREYQRYLLGRQFRADMEIATCRYMEEHPEQELNSHGQVSQKYVRKYDVAEKVGAKHNLCSTTIIKYDIYARSLDGIRSLESEVALKILSGELRVSHENMIELARLPREDIRGLKQLLAETGIDRIGYSQLRHELQWKRIPTGQPCSRTIQQRKKNSEAKIKQMPTHDPNAELSSLSYTVPSWIRIINRSIELTDFPSTSKAARSSLKTPLTSLARKIDKLLALLEEENCNGK